MRNGANSMKKDITPNRRFLIDRLGYIRNRANLSARELSQRLGFSIAYIAKFDNGDFNMPSEVLLEAIETCGSTPEEFFHTDITKYPEHKELIEKYDKLSDESKLTIKDLMNKLK